jgi:hypothetical protein
VGNRKDLLGGGDPAGSLPTRFGFLYESIAGNIVPELPGRNEPRAVKRRPKSFILLAAQNLLSGEESLL